jgi:hypothetical protein
MSKEAYKERLDKIYRNYLDKLDALKEKQDQIILGLIKAVELERVKEIKKSLKME